MTLHRQQFKQQWCMCTQINQNESCVFHIQSVMRNMFQQVMFFASYSRFCCVTSRSRMFSGSCSGSFQVGKKKKAKEIFCLFANDTGFFFYGGLSRNFLVIGSLSSLTMQ